MSELNDVIHAPNRLQICSFLASLDRAEFAAVRDMLGVSDSVASKHLKILEQAGYLEVSKLTGVVGRVKTWVALTPAGRRAFADHVAALRSLLS